MTTFIYIFISKLYYLFLQAANYLEHRPSINLFTHCFAKKAIVGRPLPDLFRVVGAPDYSDDSEESKAVRENTRKMFEWASVSEEVLKSTLEHLRKAITN